MIYVFVFLRANSAQPFNKGRIYNAAFKFIERNFEIYSNSMEHRDETKLRVNCMILHDVDLVPESDFNMYGCDPNDDAPRHLSLSIRFDSSTDFLSRNEISSQESLKILN